MVSFIKSVPPVVPNAMTLLDSVVFKPVTISVPTKEPPFILRFLLDLRVFFPPTGPPTGPATVGKGDRFLQEGGAAEGRQRDVPVPPGVLPAGGGADGAA